MDLFRADGDLFTDDDLVKALAPFQLRNKNVLVYSRLFSFGRLVGKEAVHKVLDILTDQIGPNASLSVPCYTFSAYKGEIFDPLRSKCAVGVLGEVSRHTAGFLRTIHPVYSHACWGGRAEFFNTQSRHTCFGEGSFFELFSQSEDAVVLMLGTNLNAVTNSHYYDQLFSAPGRFLKLFQGKVAEGESFQDVQFDSYVKDYDFYRDQSNCLGRLDALATEMNVIQRQRFAGGWIHTINEVVFRQLYQACVSVDPLYFLFATPQECETYSERDNFRLFHGTLDRMKVDRVKEKIGGMKL